MYICNNRGVIDIEVKANKVIVANILNENFEYYIEEQNSLNKEADSKMSKMSFNENFEDLNTDFNEELNFDSNNDIGRTLVKELDEISKKYPENYY
jgi:hypothetical protein